MRGRIEGKQGESERIAFCACHYLYNVYNAYMDATKNTGGHMKKYLLDLPVELHTAAKARAAMEQISLKELIIKAVQEYLNKG